MKKILFLASILFGVCLVACNKEQKGDVQGELIDVVFEIDRNIFTDGAGTRLDVGPGGVTNWSPGDQVIVIDHDEGRTGRVFSYLPLTSQSKGAFSGKLLSGQGTKTYYAYHMPDEADGSHRASMILDVIRGHDIGIIENQQDLEFVFGRHCGMVAIPLTFDAENPNPDPDETLSLQFHHVNSMIEARVTSNPGDRRLAELVFDEVWFTVLAGEGQLPFSTEVEIDMTRISNGSSTTIPFSEFNNSKIGSMYTWILYDEIKTLGDMIGTNYYSIPIFALPTTSDFTWTVRVEFLLGGEPVATLERYSNRTAHGLNLSGLNPHNFTEGDLVFYEPLDPSDIDPGRGGDGGGGCGDDDDDDDDDDDQGEDNDDQ